MTLEWNTTTSRKPASRISSWRWASWRRCTLQMGHPANRRSCRCTSPSGSGTGMGVPWIEVSVWGHTVSPMEIGRVRLMLFLRWVVRSQGRRACLAARGDSGRCNLIRRLLESRFQKSRPREMDWRYRWRSIRRATGSARPRPRVRSRLTGSTASPPWKPGATPCSPCRSTAIASAGCEFGALVSELADSAPIYRGDAVDGYARLEVPIRDGLRAMYHRGELSARQR